VGDETKYPPKDRLTGRPRARFGRDPDARWEAWDDEAIWRVSAAWVQHEIPRVLRTVITGEAQPACQIELGMNENDRREAIAAFCGMAESRFAQLLDGAMPIRTDELMACLAVTGIAWFPADVESMLPEKGVTDPRPRGGVVRRVHAAEKKSP
jgi:hypothetical protein